MTRKKKIVLLAAIAVVLGGIGMPLFNIVVSPERPSLAQRCLDDPQFAKTGEILRRKCLDCHSEHVALRWYSWLPLAKGLIQKDIREGRAAFDMSMSLFSEEGYFTQVDLAKLESVVLRNTMPPIQYLLMHWDMVLGKQEGAEIMSWIRHERAAKYAAPDVAEKFRGEVVQPLPLRVEKNEEIVALGEKLYNDKRLSGDDTISCATCHDLAKGGTDQSKFSTGIRGQVGPINAPTVFNSSYNFVQFWDGRAKDLQEQAGGPVLNPIEMGANWEMVLAKLQNDADYKDAFAKLYEDGMTPDNIMHAIATFEETLVTPNSAFDRHLRGEQALSEKEAKGYETFVNVGCASCHLGAALGGTHYEKMGKVESYFAVRGNVAEADYGRYNVTKNEADRHFFKIPVLRNIEVTYPYLHDGSTSDLAEVVSIMGRHQLGERLSDTQIDAIRHFLLGLTGEFRGERLK